MTQTQQTIPIHNITVFLLIKDTSRIRNYFHDFKIETECEDILPDSQKAPLQNSIKGNKTSPRLKRKMVRENVAERQD